MELGWVAGALGISVALLAASVGTDFSARRWLGAHPLASPPKITNSLT